MIDITDVKEIEAIDNIREMVGNVCEEEQLCMLQNSIFDTLDVMEEAAVIRMMTGILDGYDIDTNNIEELARIISIVIQEAGMKDAGFVHPSAVGQKCGGAKAEDQSKATEANKEGTQEEDTRKRVVLYTPGLFPKASLEDMSEGIFDSKDPGYREMRFADTDLLICFNDDDVCHLWGNSYLTGPSMIFAVDENEEMRSLEDDEVFKVLSVIIHKEEHFGMKKMPIFRLC